MWCRAVIRLARPANPDPSDSSRRRSSSSAALISERWVKAWGKLPSCSPVGADLFGEEADVVGVGQHLLEREPRVVQATGAGEGVDVPERADRERAFGSLQAVRRGCRVVAVDEAVRDEGLVDRRERREPLRDRSGTTKPTNGISRMEASRTSLPSYWVKAPTVSFQPLLHDGLVDAGSVPRSSGRDRRAGRGRWRCGCRDPARPST